MLCRDVDFPSIVVAVLDAMCAMSRTSSRGKRSSRADPFASAVATHGMHLVVSCVLSRRDSLRALASYPKLGQWLEVRPCFPVLSVGCLVSVCSSLLTCVPRDVCVCVHHCAVVALCLQLYLLRSPAASRLAVAQGLYRMCAHLPQVLTRSRSAPGTTTDPTLLFVKVDGATGASPAQPTHPMPLSEFLLRHVVSKFRLALRRPAHCGHYFALLAALAAFTADDAPSGSPKSLPVTPSGVKAVLSSSPLREDYFMAASPARQDAYSSGHGTPHTTTSGALLGLARLHHHADACVVVLSSHQTLTRSSRTWAAATSLCPTSLSHGACCSSSVVTRCCSIDPPSRSTPSAWTTAWSGSSAR